MLNQEIGLCRSYVRARGLVILVLCQPRRDAPVKFVELLDREHVQQRRHERDQPEVLRLQRVEDRAGRGELPVVSRRLIL